LGRDDITMVTSRERDNESGMRTPAERPLELTTGAVIGDVPAGSS